MAKRKKTTAARVTMAGVQSYIDSKYRNVLFVKGAGYFYVTAKNSAIDSDMERLKSTSIYVYALSHMTLSEWVEHVDALFGSPASPCKWFALCDNPATSTMSHPILGAVPICGRCAAKVARIDAMTRKESNQ